MTRHGPDEYEIGCSPRRYDRWSALWALREEIDAHLTVSPEVLEWEAVSFNEWRIDREAQGRVYGQGFAW